jgi:RAD51-like protein 2
MMAAALSEHLNKLSSAKIKANVGESEERVRERVQEKINCAASCSRDALLSGIHVFRVHEQAELVSTINMLPRFLADKPKIKLIIIDSIAFHFRQEAKDFQARTRLLSQITQLLNDLAYKNGLAVVMTNHVTHSFASRAGGGSTSLSDAYAAGSAATVWGSGLGASSSNREQRAVVPALGDLWSHSITNRISLSWDDKATGRRRATLVKSPTKAQSWAVFRVTDIGIRDLLKPTSSTTGAGAGAGAGAGSGAGGELGGGAKRLGESGQGVGEGASKQPRT